MRIAFAVVAALALTAAAPKRDWSQVATMSPAGAYVVGNPAAKVKVVEYASYTCPHCAAFARDSAAALANGKVRSGAVSLEVRHMLSGGLDLAAAITVRCGGARGFPAAHEATFAAQPQWLKQGADFQDVNAYRLAGAPPLQQLRELADGSGLTALAKSRGLTDAQIKACFADRAAIDRITALSAATPKTVLGTPTFVVNGTQVAAHDWSSLEPQLRAAGAR